MKKIICWLLFSVSCFAQLDAESSNFRTGINTIYTGVRGTDWAEENWYFDKPTHDRKTTFIKSTTPISFAHNSRNIGPNGTSRSYKSYGIAGINGEAGQIRYKADRDLYMGGGDYRYRSFTAYASNSTFTLADLNFSTGVPVLGTFGPTGPITKTGTNYYRGFLDDIGQEIHTITVWDDDQASAPGQQEWSASDGKVNIYVVNPKTPCLTWRTNASSLAQFYVTPLKVYYTPKIHKQTTFISGSCTVEINTLDDVDIRYQINGGGWVTNVDGTILTNTVFNLGTNIFEYGQVNYTNTATRTVVREPTHPSLLEQHGFAFYGSATNMAVISNKFTRNPYFEIYDMYVRGIEFQVGHQNHDDLWRRGHRTANTRSARSAMVAQMKSVTLIPNTKNAQGVYRTKSFATYAKEMLLNHVWNVDPVGFEAPWDNSNPLPARELYYRGYYDVYGTFDALFTYDFLAAKYKSTQHALGMTPIEDIFIRDVLASQAYSSMQLAGDWGGPLHVWGMWDRAHVMGSMAAMTIMPTYSTPYYGTSGWDGNTNVYPWAPFPDYPLTWKQVFWDSNTQTRTMPNVVTRLDADDLYCITGWWKDRLDYGDFKLMGGTVQMWVNVLKLNGGSHGPNMQMGFELALAALLQSCNPSTDPPDDKLNQYKLNLMNNKFTDLVAIGLTRAKKLYTNSSTSHDAFITEFKDPFSLVFYDDTASGTTATEGTAVQTRGFNSQRSLRDR